MTTTTLEAFVSASSSQRTGSVQVVKELRFFGLGSFTSLSDRDIYIYKYSD